MLPSSLKFSRARDLDFFEGKYRRRKRFGKRLKDPPLTLDGISHRSRFSVASVHAPSSTQCKHNELIIPREEKMQTCATSLRVCWKRKLKNPQKPDKSDNTCMCTFLFRSGPALLESAYRPLSLLGWGFFKLSLLTQIWYYMESSTSPDRQCNVLAVLLKTCKTSLESRSKGHKLM